MQFCARKNKNKRVVAREFAQLDFSLPISFRKLNFMFRKTQKQRSEKNMETEKIDLNEILSNSHFVQVRKINKQSQSEIKFSKKRISYQLHHDR
jgi:hypothetical protein